MTSGGGRVMLRQPLHAQSKFDRWRLSVARHATGRETAGSRSVALPGALAAMFSAKACAKACLAPPFTAIRRPADPASLSLQGATP
jgi:hypothetical protein